MGLLAYNLLLFLYRISASILAVFDKKARLFVDGRRGIFPHLETHFKTVTEPVVWVHAASLGEFEQSRPVIESIRASLPQIQILLTFFSPSGYEVRRDYKMVNITSYLPHDSRANSRQFLEIVKPSLILFAKYEFWYHYSQEATERGIPLVSFSSIFRENQMFFKSYGGLQRKILRNFSHFFVQDEKSKELLQSIEIKNVNVSGDTRFDRVTEIAKNTDEIEQLESFISQKVIVIGSAWLDDLKIWAPIINDSKFDLQFVIAPHEVNEATLSAFESLIDSEIVRFSSTEINRRQRVLLIDNIGLLSKLYRYADIAYVGGALGKGLHNILEAAVYGVPVIFGKKSYHKFQEALDLIDMKGAFSVGSTEDLKTILRDLLTDAVKYEEASAASSQYVDENLGATAIIVEYCLKAMDK